MIWQTKSSPHIAALRHPIPIPHLEKQLPNTKDTNESKLENLEGDVTDHGYAFNFHQTLQSFEDEVVVLRATAQ